MHTLHIHMLIHLHITNTYTYNTCIIFISSSMSSLFFLLTDQMRRELIFSKHRFKVTRSPSHVQHLASTSELPLKEFPNQIEQYCTPSEMIDSCEFRTDLYNMNYYGSRIPSQTETTLLHDLGPYDLPPLYQPAHRASI